MDAAVLHAFGQPPRFEQFPEPSPGKGEVVVHVHAAALKPSDKQLTTGRHYASPRELPVVCGGDEVGRLDDGSRVFFGRPRRPFGAMAQSTVVPSNYCFTVTEGVDDDTAAALPSTGVSAWLALSRRAQLARGETILILGATGFGGKLAVQISRLLGARRIIAAGHNERVLRTLHKFGADATIHLDMAEQDLTAAFAREAGHSGFHVIIDYLRRGPTQALLTAIARRKSSPVVSEVRLVRAGESAGPTVEFPAAVVRSAPLTIQGAADVFPREVFEDAYQQVMSRAAGGQLRVDTDRVPLADIEDVWYRRHAPGRRLIVIP
jgi:NADPH:quinone reductase-like Zn-dependent oxidoreductase